MKCHLCPDKECATNGKNCHNSKVPIFSDWFYNASVVEASYYNQYNRFQELVKYCQINKISKLGVAFCIGLSAEALTFCDMLSAFKFDIVSVCCKVGGISKSDLKIKQINADKFEPICNPYYQADICNKNSTQLNIILGLCMGHDIEFTKNSEAPVTTFIVKDRVLGHNPVACLYSNYVKSKTLNI